jgi:hypothetical protein
VTPSHTDHPTSELICRSWAPKPGRVRDRTGHPRRSPSWPVSAPSRVLGTSNADLGLAADCGYTTGPGTVHTGSEQRQRERARAIEISWWHASWLSEMPTDLSLPPTYLYSSPSSPFIDIFFALLFLLSIGCGVQWIRCRFVCYNHWKVRHTALTCPISLRMHGIGLDTILLIPHSASVFHEEWLIDV